MDNVFHESLENSFYSIEIFSALGTNYEQEDAVGYLMEDTSALLILCDGMGGMNGGRVSAQAAVKRIEELANSEDWSQQPLQFLDKAIELADETVFYLKDANGERVNGGCTLVLALIVGRRIYYANVGDSRAYFWDGKSFLQLTEDHNYGELLMRKLEAGEINKEEYVKESVRASSLTAFIGLGESKEKYMCQEPILLDRSQVLCIQSDGLYKLVTEEEMKDIIDKNAKDLEKTGWELLKKAEENRIKYQDNTSFMLMRLK